MCVCVCHNRFQIGLSITPISVLRHSYYLLFNCLNYSSSFKIQQFTNSLFESLSLLLSAAEIGIGTIQREREVAWLLPQIIRIFDSRSVAKMQTFTKSLRRYAFAVCTPAIFHYSSCCSLSLPLSCQCKLKNGISLPAPPENHSNFHRSCLMQFCFSPIFHKIRHQSHVGRLSLWEVFPKINLLDMCIEHWRQFNIFDSHTYYIGIKHITYNHTHAHARKHIESKIYQLPVCGAVIVNAWEFRS